MPDAAPNEFTLLQDKKSRKQSTSLVLDAYIHACTIMLRTSIGSYLIWINKPKKLFVGRKLLCFVLIVQQIVNLCNFCYAGDNICNKLIIRESIPTACHWAFAVNRASLCTSHVECLTAS